MKFTGHPCVIKASCRFWIAEPLKSREASRHVEKSLNKDVSVFKRGHFATKGRMN